LSSTTETTSTGSLIVRTKRRTVTMTRSPGETAPGGSTVNPLAVFTPQRSTPSAARVHTPSPWPMGAVISERRYPRELARQSRSSGSVTPHLSPVCRCARTARLQRSPTETHSPAFRERISSDPPAHGSALHRAVDVRHGHLGPHAQQPHLPVGVDRRAQLHRRRDELRAAGGRFRQLASGRARLERRVAHFEVHAYDRSALRGAVGECLTREVTDGGVDLRASGEVLLEGDL